jgi:hypothetical protein
MTYLLVQFSGRSAHIDKPIKELITNLNDLRKKIIALMGENVSYMYGLTQEWLNWKIKSQGLGM